jgi:nicotinate-nucleotide pyrophosphorylase (carboxylating)
VAHAPAALPRDLRDALDDLLTRAFAEEGEDVTSLAVFGPAAGVSARLFAFLHPPARAEALVADGAVVKPGRVIARVDGPAITVLAAERIALNLVQRLSGIATRTREFADALRGTRCVLLDTRKTTPGLRLFERYAVRCGGGTNHRFGLSHGFLVKDNHPDGAGSAWEATRRVADFRDLNPRLRRHLLEAEARTVDEVHQALDAGADRILLDNMGLPEMRRAVKDVALFREATGRDVTVEASGGMTPAKARAAAAAGADFVSAGALTHSARAIDVALEVGGEKTRSRRPGGLRRR